MSSTSSIVSIGKISYQEKDHIANGGTGAVYKGTFAGMPVAIKKVAVAYIKIVQMEVNLLLRSETHPNVIRYFHTETTEHGFYIVLTLCDYTLVEYVRNNYDNLNLTPLKLLRQVTEGLKFLHDNHIIHHDLKPLNILISLPNSNKKRRPIISDFGISKVTVNIGDSATLTTARGTTGWMAPEVFVKKSVTNAIDIFSLGCIYYYVLTSGKQLFHSSNDVQKEILYTLLIEEAFSSPGHSEYRNLILKMVARDPSVRLSCNQILPHHIFWDDKMTASFIQNLSGFLLTNKEAQELVDADSFQVIGDNWFHLIPDDLVADIVLSLMSKRTVRSSNIMSREEFLSRMQKHYRSEKLSSLLRVIRNIYVHYDEIIELTKNEIATAEGCIPYFLRLFPKFLTHTYDTIAESPWNVRFSDIFLRRDVTIGDITCNLEQKLYHHSRNGSKFYKGKFKEMNVVIKMVPLNAAELEDNKYNTIRYINHKNVIKLFHKEKDEMFMYIALTPAQCNLKDYVEKSILNGVLPPLTLLRQVTRGLAFLHESNILHRSLQPQNILISYANDARKRRALITGFEFSLNIEAMMNQLLRQDTPPSWTSPDLFSVEFIRKMLTASDIYLLGLLYFYVVSKGHLLESHDRAEQIAALDLQWPISKMLSLSTNERPNCSELLGYPSFWSMTRKINFVKDVLNFVSQNEKVKKDLSLKSPLLIRTEWIERLDAILLSDLARVHTNVRDNDGTVVAREIYSGDDIYSIIKILLDINEHHDVLLDTSRNVFKPFQGGHIEYVISRLPETTDIIYDAMKNWRCRALLARHYGQLPPSCAKSYTWSDVDPTIIGQILSKLPQNLLKATLISKSWKESTVSMLAARQKQRFPYTCQHMVDLTARQITHISVSHDGKLLAVCCDSTFHVFQLSILTPKFSTNINQPFSSYFNAKNTLVSVCSSDKTVILSISEGLPAVCSLTSHSQVIEHPWLLDNLIMSSNQDNDVASFWLWNIPEVNEFKVFQVTNRVFKPKLFPAPPTGFSLVYYTESKLCIKRFSWKYIDYCNNIMKTMPQPTPVPLSLAPDREIVSDLSIVDYILAPDRKETKLYVLLKTEADVYSFKILGMDTYQLTESNLNIPSDYVYHNAIVSNHRYIISGSESSFVYIWDLKSRNCTKQSCHYAGFLHCTLNPIDPKMLITAASRDGTIKSWLSN